MKKQAIIKQTIIHDLKIDYETEHRKIKHPRLEFKTGKLLLVLPENYGKEKQLMEKYRNWIYKKNLIIELAKKDAEKKIVNPKEDKELKDFVHYLIKKYSKETGVESKDVCFRKLKSKWGSCGSKRLTFNTLLKYLPENLIKYIVFHEVVHLREKDHNKRFWDTIFHKFKNYQKNEKELLAYWFLVQDSIKEKF